RAAAAGQDEGDGAARELVGRGNGRHDRSPQETANACSLRRMSRRPAAGFPSGSDMSLGRLRQRALEGTAAGRLDEDAALAVALAMVLHAPVGVVADAARLADDEV